MTGLQFRFKEVIEEIDAVAFISREFTAPESGDVWASFQRSLRSIRDSVPAGKTAQWVIPPDRPLKTIPTSDYKGTDGGRHDVIARVTCNWSVTPLGDASSRPKATFSLGGAAETKVEILRAANESEVLCWWSMEIGGDEHPGCYFHVQLRSDDDGAPFPHYLEVPRLPTFICTPMMVVEFVLGELFQHRWPKEVERGGGTRDLWRGIQWNRFRKFLDWQLEKLEQGKKGPASPWLVLKRAKPPESLLI